MKDHSERPAIWEAIQQEKINLATRNEKRSVTDWIAAVIQRVLAKQTVAPEAIAGAPWTAEMVMETWLTMAIQGERHWMAVSRKLASQLKEALGMADTEDNPPDEGEMPPDGSSQAILLQEGPYGGDGTVITREAVETARASMSVGQPYTDRTSLTPEAPVGTLTRIWTAEVDGKLTLYVWLTPDGAPAGALIQ